MALHWHRNEKTMFVNGVLYFGVAESKNLFVGTNGTFITQQKIDGAYRGSIRGGSRTKYYRVHPSKNTDDYAHRIVFEICLGCEIPDGMEIDHINGDSLDNRVENLRAATPRDNTNNPITLARVKSAAIERSASPEFRRKVSEGRRRFNESDAGKAFARRLSDERTGIPLSEGHRTKLKASAEKHKIPIVGICVKTGVAVEFASQQDAAEELGIQSPNINACLRGRQTTAGGWSFEYKSDYRKKEN